MSRRNPNQIGEGLTYYLPDCEVSTDEPDLANDQWNEVRQEFIRAWNRPQLARLALTEAELCEIELIDFHASGEQGGIKSPGQ